MSLLMFSAVSGKYFTYKTWIRAVCPDPIPRIRPDSDPERIQQIHRIFGRIRIRCTPKNFQLLLRHGRQSQRLLSSCSRLDWLIN